MASGASASAGAEGSGSSPQNTFYLSRLDREYVLPDDGKPVDIIPRVFCMTVECTETPWPVCIYECGTAEFGIDNEEKKRKSRMMPT